MNRKKSSDKTSKQEQLDEVREYPDREFLTTNQGVRVSHDDDSLKAGERGPTLLEDFHFREKITHFDHERIPERVVHARGSGAHGYFQVYESMAEYTKAAFLAGPRGARRRSSCASRPSPARAARPTRSATCAASRPSSTPSEGNFDLVGNNMPVFFIQDAIKFPDLVHAVKPEPHNEMPQASSAHDTFWDFVSLSPRRRT